MGHILYVDEVGCTGVLPSSHSLIQPIFCVNGLILPQDALYDLTRDLMTIKRNHNPSMALSLRHGLDIVLYEIKGSDLRKDIRSSSRNKRRRAIGFLDKVIGLIQKYDGKILARSYIKGIGTPFDGNAVYTAAMQRLYTDFQAFLEESDSDGYVIVDSRKKHQNNSVSYSIFTQKFKASGDGYNRIREMPLFGHSENHIGLQLSDWMASAILFPAMSHAYCNGHIASIHVQPAYQTIGERYIPQIRHMQYRYQDKSGSYYGGISVRDGILQKRSARHLFNTFP